MNIVICKLIPIEQSISERRLNFAGSCALGTNNLARRALHAAIEMKNYQWTIDLKDDISKYDLKTEWSEIVENSQRIKEITSYSARKNAGKILKKQWKAITKQNSGKTKTKKM